MNIPPPQASTPVTGIDPLGIQGPVEPMSLKPVAKPNRARPPVIPPDRFWPVTRMLIRLRSDVPAESLLEMILRPGSRSHGKKQRGNPGAGMVHGRQNIAKTVTYRRRMDLPLDFNTERNERRRQWQEMDLLSNYRDPVPAFEMDA
jgi:hypothetical protein